MQTCQVITPLPDSPPAATRLAPTRIYHVDTIYRPQAHAGPWLPI